MQTYAVSPFFISGVKFSAKAANPIHTLDQNNPTVPFTFSGVVNPPTVNFTLDAHGGIEINVVAAGAASRKESYTIDFYAKVNGGKKQQYAGGSTNNAGGGVKTSVTQNSLSLMEDIQIVIKRGNPLKPLPTIKLTKTATHSLTNPSFTIQ